MACDALTRIDIPASVRNISAMKVLRTFNGEPGTYAETFARQNSLKFVSGDAPPVQVSVFPTPTAPVTLA